MLLAALSLPAQHNTPILPAGDQFAVAVEQYGQPVSPEGHTVTLRKDTFTLVFAFRGEDAVLVGASFTPESYGPAAAGAPLEEIPVFDGMGMAEAPFNPDSLLMVNRSSPSYWHYFGDSEHRFTTITREKGIIVCRRTVAAVLYLETTGDIVPVGEMAEDTLYFVFARTEWADDYSRQIELQRDYLKIQFE